MPRHRRADSPYTEIALELAEELRDARESVREKSARFMHEDVEPAEMLRRAEHMTPAQRKELPRAAVLLALRSRKQDGTTTES